LPADLHTNGTAMSLLLLFMRIFNPK
jgi:hypothetical protein